MVKTVKLPERPKPPDKEQILEDLKSAGDDDVIFSDLKTQSCKWKIEDEKPVSVCNIKFGITCIILFKVWLMFFSLK